MYVANTAVGSAILARLAGGKDDVGRWLIGSRDGVLTETSKLGR